MSNNNSFFYHQHAKTYYSNTIETDTNIITIEGYYYSDFPTAGEEVKIIKDKSNNIINRSNKTDKKLCPNCGYYYTNNDICPACHQHQIKNRKLIK